MTGTKGASGVYPRETGPGLARMLAATPEGLCPFCLESATTKVGIRGVIYCGDPICLAAFHRCYKRDLRAGVPRRGYNGKGKRPEPVPCACSPESFAASLKPERVLENFLAHVSKPVEPVLLLNPTTFARWTEALEEVKKKEPS